MELEAHIYSSTHAFCFKNGYWRWLSSSSCCFCTVSTRLNIWLSTVFSACVWNMSHFERLIENTSWKYILEYTTKSTSKGTSDDGLHARKKLTVKVLFATVSAVSVFKLAFPRYLCFYLRSPVQIKDCALNFMIACVNYGEIEKICVNTKRELDKNVRFFDSFSRQNHANKRAESVQRKCAVHCGTTCTPGSRGK